MLILTMTFHHQLNILVQAFSQDCRVHQGKATTYGKEQTSISTYMSQLLTLKMIPWNTGKRMYLNTLIWLNWLTDT